MVNSFRLPNGTECQVIGDTFVVDDTRLTLEDVAELTRNFFTVSPLRQDDVRLRLVDEIRTAVVKEEPKTRKRWLVLDTLRQVSLKKLRSRHKAAA